jgi:hypothetical protein
LGHSLAPKKELIFLTTFLKNMNDIKNGKHGHTVNQNEVWRQTLNQNPNKQGVIPQMKKNLVLITGERKNHDFEISSSDGLVLDPKKRRKKRMRRKHKRRRGKKRNKTLRMEAQTRIMEMIQKTMREITVQTTIRD